MSPNNVDVVRRAYEALNAGGTIDDVMDRLTPLLDPEVEWVNPPDALETGTRAGLDGWRTALVNIRIGLGENVMLEVQEITGDGDAVFATGKAHVSGTSSGVEVAGPTWAAIWNLHGGRIRRYEYSWDPVAMRDRFERSAAGQGRDR